MDSSSSCARLNQAVASPDYVRLGDLTVGLRYRVLDLSYATTKFGKCILALLRPAGTKEPPVYVWLPKRMRAQLSEEDIAGIDVAETPLFLIFNGRRPNATAYDITFEN